MVNDIFKIQDYKAFIKDLIRGQAKNGYGIRSKLAKHIGCQTSYLSQILNGSLDLTIEQAELVSQFFQHSEDEKDFFLLLVQYEKAGTKSLRDYFKNQLEKILKKRLVLKERIKTQTEISSEDQSVYYSSWIYSFTYVMLSIPKFQNKIALAEELKLPLEKITNVLGFLVKCGLAREEKGLYKISPHSLHLAHDSHLISKHHSNWRLQALNAIDRGSDELHYSTVFSLSEKDVTRARSLLTDAIAQINKMMAASPEETVRSFCVDFFKPY